MSGGVDSSVAAVLLKEQGYQVGGVFMRLGIEGDEESEKSARAVADKLKIKFYVLDLSKEFKKKIINYFISEYKNGRTPNPCVMCNKEIKFGVLLDKVLEMGADFVATGHYARLQCLQHCHSDRSDHEAIAEGERSGGICKGDMLVPHKDILKNTSHFPTDPSAPTVARDDKFKLLKAKDKNKDQSYFLYNLTQEKLNYCLFPLGEYNKREVRELARGYKLPVLERDESQEVCFIKSKRYGDFLKKHLKLISGDIVNLAGDKIGRHQGLPLYTIGQRREIGIGGTGPYYVVGTDFENNKLIVSNDADDPALYSKELMAEKVNWIAGEIPKPPLKIKAKIRYRSKEVSATVNQENKDKYKVIFKTSQRAITPGQSVVFYLKDEVLGGGIISL